MALTVSRVTVEPQLRQWHAVSAAAGDADHIGLPADPLQDLLPLLTGRTTGHLVEVWLGTTRDGPVAATLLRMPVHDNLAVVSLSLYVHPRARRAGHGRAMRAHAIYRARHHGRSRIVAEVTAPLGDGPEAPGPAFARAAGARPVLSEVRRVLDLTAVGEDRLAGMRDAAAAAAPGYRLLQWVDRAPAGLHADLARLAARMTTDVPMQELDWEPEVWTAERYAATEAETRDRGRRRVVSAVQDRSTGRLAGYTDIGVSLFRPQVAYQWDTIVLPEHRGHGLGLLLKFANLQLLRQEIPAAEVVHTWNADDNPHMVRINDAVGFRPVERHLEEQLDLPAGGPAAPPPGVPR